MNIENKRFRMLVEQMGIRETEVARILNTSLSNVSRWINGTRNISDYYQDKICQHFNVTKEWLKAETFNIPKESKTKKLIVAFYPEEYDLYYAIKAQRFKVGSIGKYVKDTLREDLNNRL